MLIILLVDNEINYDIALVGLQNNSAYETIFF